MRGIAGIVCGQTQPDTALLERMARRLRHRGPDASGIHRHGPVGQVHSRLSIIDVAGGAQPMVNDETGVAVTFNGESSASPNRSCRLGSSGVPSSRTGRPTR